MNNPTPEEIIKAREALKKAKMFKLAYPDEHATLTALLQPAQPKPLHKHDEKSLIACMEHLHQYGMIEDLGSEFVLLPPKPAQVEPKTRCDKAGSYCKYANMDSNYPRKCMDCGHDEGEQKLEEIGEVLSAAHKRLKSAAPVDVDLTELEDKICDYLSYTKYHKSERHAVKYALDYLRSRGLIAQGWLDVPDDLATGSYLIVDVDGAVGEAEKVDGKWYWTGTYGTYYDHEVYARKYQPLPSPPDGEK